MEAIEVLTDFMEQFGFKIIFIFFHKIKTDPDVSENGHTVASELKIHKGAWKTCPGKIKCKIMFKTYSSWFYWDCTIFSMPKSLKCFIKKKK